MGTHRAWALWTPVHCEVGRVNQPSSYFSHLCKVVWSKKLGVRAGKYRKLVKKKRGLIKPLQLGLQLAYVFCHPKQVCAYDDAAL